MILSVCEPADKTYSILPVNQALLLRGQEMLPGGKMWLPGDNILLPGCEALLPGGESLIPRGNMLNRSLRVICFDRTRLDKTLCKVRDVCGICGCGF